MENEMDGNLFISHQSRHNYFDVETTCLNLYLDLASQQMFSS